MCCLISSASYKQIDFLDVIMDRKNDHRISIYEWISKYNNNNNNNNNKTSDFVLNSYKQGIGQDDSIIEALSILYNIAICQQTSFVDSHRTLSPHPPAILFPKLS